MVFAALLLAACGDVDPPECTTAPSAPTADTSVTFQVDGRPVILETTGWSPGFYHDTTGGEAILPAWSGTLEDYDWLAIRIHKFHGTGAYPVYVGGTAEPFASIDYGCRAENVEQWLGKELVPDTVYVTTYDSVSTLIEGTFSARLTGYRYGGDVQLTDGSFRGLLPRY